MLDDILGGLNLNLGGGEESLSPISSFTIPSEGFSLGGAPSGGFEIPSGGLDLGNLSLPPVPSLSSEPLGNLNLPGGGGGLDDILGPVSRSFERDPFGAIGKAASLGTTGMGLYSSVKAMQQGAQQNKLMREEQRRQQGIAAPAAHAGSALTEAGTQAMLGGPLPPQLEQMVDKFRSETRARLQSYFAKAGITDSTMMEEMDSWVEQQVGTYREQLAQQLLQSGYQGVGVALAPSSAAGSTAERQMGGTADFLKQAQQSINLLTGSQA